MAVISRRAASFVWREFARRAKFRYTKSEEASRFAACFMMKNSKMVKGKKVFLRFPREDDFAEFTAANKASRKFHHNLVNPPTDAQGFADFLRRNETETDRCFLICQTEDGAIVGGMCLSQIFRKAFQNAYLGYYLF